MSQGHRKPPKGFSLVELLVILAVLGLLVGMLVPAVQKGREAAASSQCLNNLRQIGLAMHNCEGTYKQLPPVAGPFPAKQKSYGTFFYHIAPSEALQSRAGAECSWRRNPGGLGGWQRSARIQPHQPANLVVRACTPSGGETLGSDWDK